MKLKKENNKKINEMTTDMIDISKSFTFGIQREAGESNATGGIQGSTIELYCTLLDVCHRNEDIKDVIMEVALQLSKEEIISIMGKPQ